ncbi:NADH-quinone oxidoreductase subunit J [Massilibacterium senegalense]|uniref:NADH-quinone oxidoreductase subunit J n=1 Tax=Massilibacterium senegalense TaxID=1632858 RepID=UPI000781ECCD|nr:NADH-quinone oxidoreductase subunit J [Massilibacterium senegalense]
MSGEMIAFLILAFLAISGGVLLLMFENVMYMLLSLILTFLSIAGLYVLLSAEFIAFVQVLIYSGAIAIIMIFGIMLTKHRDKQQSVTNKPRAFLVLLGVIGFFTVVWFAIGDISFTEQATTLHENNTGEIGKLLFSHYVIPFELTSVVLLVALIGAIVLAKKEDEPEKKEAEQHE